MSVENQATTESATIDESVVGVTGQSETCSRESCGGSVAAIGDGKLVSEDGAENPGLQIDLSGARSWFEGLTAEQRAEAMSFSDNLFLETFLATLPWSTAEESVRAGGCVEWGEQVDISIFKRVWASHMTTESEIIGSASNTNGCSLITTAKSPEPSKFGEEEDFRIRGYEDSKDEGEQVNLLHVTAPLSDLLNSIRITVPAAVSFLAPSLNSEECSYVVFTPSVLKKMKDEELLNELDAASQVLFKSSFLSNSDSINERRLRVDSGRKVHTVPFFAIILSRLEMAIIDSYTRSASMNRSETDTEKDESVPSNHNFLLLKQFDECKRNMYKLESELEKGLVVDVLRPFKMSSGLDDSLDVSIESVILTPLSYFRAIKSGLTSLESINDGVKQSLTLLEKAKSSVEIVMCEEEDIADKRINGYETQITKKKKKRSKRRKPRKSSHDEDVGNLGKGQVEAPQKINNEKPIVGEKQVAKKQPQKEVAKNLLTPKQMPEVVQEENAELSDSDDAESLDSRHSICIDNDTVSNADNIGNTMKEQEVAVATTSQVHPDNTHGVDDEIKPGETEQHHEEDEDNWETVEVRSRANRKRPSDRGSTHGSRRNNASGKGHAADASVSKRNKHRTASSRKKNANRKVVRDIISNVLDTVEDEVRAKDKKSVLLPGSNQWKSGPPVASRSPQPKKSQGSENPAESKKPATLRDIVLGKSSATHKNPAHVEQVTSVPSRLTKVDEKKRGNETDKKQTQSNAVQPSPLLTPKLAKGQSGAGLADQNTAPTYQETVSAVSASSNLKAEAKHDVNALEDRTSKSDLSSGDTDEAPQNREKAPALETQSDISPNPPFPTLLSPENANSATSSVASSLEVPHGSHRHHAGSASDVNDVGYHLLDVCDRLSRDMSLFMSRRALALNARRRERGALLVALQDVASSIWPGRCHVELYGSCATHLDLPSSDIDVVVLGLDRLMVNHPIEQAYVRSKSGCSETQGSKRDESNSAGRSRQRQAIPVRAASLPVSGFIPMPPQMNADRVIQLANKIEQQPWAVRVNPIPTASVPVVKVLADPSKLVGFGQGNDWVSRQHPMSGHAAAGPPQTLLPWRGADVMNGLLSLDITFEGPEHGGIGSTEFSARVVTEVCQEAGLHPDATPFVQVLMVLKELLAQRKLNEPYSGGLSSYALLLLVVALMRERAVIREELERVERQRMAMANGDVTTSYSTARALRIAPSAIPEANLKHDGNAMVASDRNHDSHDQDQNTRSLPSRQSPAASSWASIAKIYSSSASVQSAPQPLPKTGTVENKSYQKAASFARALARSQPTATQVSVVDNNGTGTRRKDQASNNLPQGRGAESTKPPEEILKGGSLADDHVRSTPFPEVPLGGAPSFFPQGFNDIIEVLCSGETTAGKLLMHFLLFYGQHFDAQTTAIDVSGKHERGFDHGQVPPYSYLSPYIQRRAPGSIDPVTGMLTVDPIVIYDPLEGAENNNVARRCFCWNSVRWIFAQSYATLSSAVERSATPPSTPIHKTVGSSPSRVGGAPGPDVAAEESCDMMDPSSPLLRCLLSF